jgi:hypothetical protein
MPAQPVTYPTDTRLHVSMTVAVVVVGVVVAAIALIAGLLLANAWPNSDWIPVYQDVLKTSFGALAVGGLGGLAKLIFDQRKAQEAAADEQRKERRPLRPNSVKAMRPPRPNFVTGVMASSRPWSKLSTTLKPRSSSSGLTGR